VLRFALPHKVRESILLSALELDFGLHAGLLPVHALHLLLRAQLLLCVVRLLAQVLHARTRPCDVEVRVGELLREQRGRLAQLPPHVPQIPFEAVQLLDAVLRHDRLPRVHHLGLERAGACSELPRGHDGVVGAVLVERRLAHLADVVELLEERRGRVLLLHGPRPRGQLGGGSIRITVDLLNGARSRDCLGGGIVSFAVI